MAQTRLPVRKIREVLRLKAAGLSDRQIALSIGSARSTVQECVRRASAAGLSWPLANGLDESSLHARLYHRAVPLSRRPTPDFAALHAELARPGVTRVLLWQEYKAAHPDGWQYSVFCDRYQRWLAGQERVLRQHHAPGEKLFVDYAGQTVPITDRYSGEERAAQIFVAVLGCSNYTYAEATFSQQLPDWLGAHVRALAYIGGVPRAIVPDNLRSAISRAHRYEPTLNPSYQDFAEHYGVTILPARVRKPRDKAKVEAGVLVVERWILARLRHHTFFSLGELNNAIAVLLEHLNTRAFKKLEGCRRSHFLERDRPALQPLPPRPYEFGEWRRAKVHPDYHIEVKRAYYSVPYRLIGQQVDVRVTAHAVEIFLAGSLVAAHVRAAERGRRSTHETHRPPAHVAVIERSMTRVLERATVIGPATVEVLCRQAAHRKHVEETLRSALGILRLAKDFSPAQLEEACTRALALRSYSYRTVRALIATPAQPITPDLLDLGHDNVRGPGYFQ
jgi:transposase